MKFKHYIVTRFLQNVGTPDPEGWLESRVDLFNNFHIKSKLNQTNQNFESIFLVSGEYMDWDFSSFHFNKINHRILNAEDFPNNLLTKEDKDLDCIITSRVDSDDILAKNYIQNIQSHARLNSIMDHSEYFMLSSDLKRYSIRRPKLDSMFLSTCFHPNDINSSHCMVDQHPLMSRHFSGKININGVGSAAIIHGGNISNDIDRQNARNLEDDELIKIFGNIR